MEGLRMMRRFLLVAFLIVFTLSFAAVQYKDGKVVFTFKSQAQVVYLAGSFNNWSPTAWPMKLIDGVWVYEVELKPGTYQYKYVIDGKTWKEDPEAPAYTDDGFGGKNGMFTLTPDGKILGQAESTQAQPTGKKYVLNEKRENTIFVDVDGYVIIRYYNKDAKQPYIAGSFNNWKADDTPLYFIEDGWWEAVLELKPGVYEYKFVVDGNWIPDPNAFAYTDDGFGGLNSVLEVAMESGKLVVRAPAGAVKEGKQEQVVKVEEKPAVVTTVKVTPGLSIVDGKVVFVVKKENAQEAYLAGTFNGWNPRAQKMQLVDGYWVTSLALQPGVHKYKYVFVIGGNDVWEEDLHAPGYEPDGFGGKNGVFNLVQKDGLLKIEGVEAQSGGLPVKGKYEFTYTLQTNATNYLVFSGATSKLTLTFTPNPDLSLSLTYGGAAISNALLRMKNDGLLVGFHYKKPWTLPVEGKDTGIVFSYEIAKDTSIVFGLGYESNKLPLIAGIEFGGIRLFGAKDYYTNNYSVVGEYSLQGAINVSLVGLYSLDNSYYFALGFDTELLGLSVDFDGSIIGMSGNVVLGKEKLAFSGSFDISSADLSGNVTYIADGYKVGLGYTYPTKVYLLFGLFDKEKGLNIKIENPDITDIMTNTIMISGYVNF
ncbi:Glycogen recognition site of AMP-activated protein kinase [Fervidobacterium changbaicum]|nr:glycoside hydrolase family 13 [Fervidobacterium changbaicum]SDH10556.1 Glycogen recognition site of AMP-activated protein kinase [Fervidobacterium changbaicum]